MRNYNKENIMSSYLDMFCLVCEAYLRNVKDVNRHIQKPIHKNNLSKTYYVEKYKNDYIKKVPIGYYCECCNLLFKILSKVEAHVEEDSHLANKTSDVLRREGQYVIVHNKLLIDERTWQGIKDNTCSVCITEVENEDIHRTQTSHVLNLMTKKIVFGPNNCVYRVIDEDIFQCLTCNDVLPMNVLKTHFNEAQHNEKLKKCTDSYYAINNKHKKNRQSLSKIFNGPHGSVEFKNKMKTNVNNTMQPAESESFKKAQTKNGCEVKLPNVNTNSVNHVSHLFLNRKDNVAKEERKQEKILEFIETFSKNEINVNFETETAFCKKCIKHIDFDYELINNHIEEDKRIGKQKVIADYVPFQCDAKTKRPPENYHKRYQNTTNINGTSSTTDKRSAIVPYKNKNINEEQTQEVKDKTKNEQAKQNVDTDNTNKDEESNNLDNDPILYAKLNHLTYNRNNKVAFCRICNTRIPSALYTMKEHVKGAKHRTMLWKHEQASISKCQSARFFDDVTMTKDLAFINYKICIKKDSFFMVSSIDDLRFRCFICDVTFFGGQISTHLKTSLHDDILKKIPVITCLNNEFVRELRTGLYHCGYCNICITDWKELNCHLNTDSHLQQASKLKFLLHRNLPKLKQYKFEKAMESLFFNMF